jgi:NTE family protein
MLEAFDELGIKPSVIVGCSMGALVGAAYACGMTAKEVRMQAERLLSNRLEMMKYVFSTRQSKLTDLLALKSLSALHLNGEKLADLALPDHLPQLIEQAPIPLRIVTTDYELMEEHLLTSGSVIKAVAASIAIPGLITAPHIDGKLHVDGGITNPVPFNHAREGADIVVAIDVTGRPRLTNGRHPGSIELAVGAMLIMFSKIAELRRALGEPEVYIKPATETFGAGDFFRVREIFEAAQPAKEELKRRLAETVEKFETGT